MSKLLNKLFGALLDKPWESEQAAIDNAHEGKLLIFQFKNLQYLLFLELQQFYLA